MEKQTEEDIAYAILSLRAMEYLNPKEAIIELNNNYKFFRERGHTPIAAAILGQQHARKGDDARSELEEVCEKIKSLNK